MIIEFQNTAGEVQDWVIGYIRSKLTQLHKKHREISRAQVCLQSSSEICDNGKVCEINLTTGAGHIFFCSTAKTYEAAARETIVELDKMIEEKQIRKNPGLPDELPNALL